MGLGIADFESPEETRAFDKGKADLVPMGGMTIGRFRFEPGWRWSECVKPIVGTDSCQGHHVGYAAGGSMHVVADDGSEIEIKGGQVYEITPGHDAWVTGSEAFVGYEFKSAQDYGKPPA